MPFDEVIREGMVGSAYWSTMHSFSDLTAMAEFRRIGDAVAEVARTSGKPPMLLSLCQWGRVSSSLTLELGIV